MAEPAPVPDRAQPWLFGPLPDLLIGCGLLYALALPAFFVYGGEIRARQADALMPLLVLCVSLPALRSDAAACLRGEGRPAALPPLRGLLVARCCSRRFVAALHLPLVAAVLVTLYLTWSPWHYTAQNFGLASMFLRRRGAAVGPLLGRSLRLSFIFSYGLVFLLMHTGEGTPADYAVPLGDDAARFVGLGIPPRRFAAAGRGAAGGLSREPAAPRWSLVLRATTLRAAAPDAGPAAHAGAVVLAPDHGRRCSASLAGSTRSIGATATTTSAGSRSAMRRSTCGSRRTTRGAPSGWNGFGIYLTKAAMAATAVWVFPVVLFAPGGPRHLFLRRGPRDAGRPRRRTSITSSSTA